MREQKSERTHIKMAAVQLGNSTNAAYKKLNDLEEEEEVPRHAFYDGMSDIERVFPLNYAQLEQQARRGLWSSAGCWAFSYTVYAFTIQDNWFILLMCGMLPLIVFSFVIQSKHIANIASQHVALTTTGIRYDRHNFPTGTTFHTTLHIPFCEIKSIERKNAWCTGSYISIVNQADGCALTLVGIAEEEELVAVVKNRISSKDAETSKV